MDLLHVGQAFFMLLIIMGPFTGLPVFLKITEKFDDARRARSANRAIRFSVVMFVFFVFFGTGLLDLFGISFEGFKIAGGIVLLLLGVTYMFHIEMRKERNYTTDILVPFATPLVIGPGVITTVILLVSSYGYVVTLIGGWLALLVYWLFLRFSKHIVARIGHQGIEVVARFMGLLLMAIAVDMMKSGIAGFMAGG